MPTTARRPSNRPPAPGVLLGDLSDAEVLSTIRALLEERRRRFAERSREELVDELGWINDVLWQVDIHFNEAASAIDHGRHPKHWRWPQHKKYFLDRVGPGTRVLDVGCGASSYLLWMAEKGASITAVDLNPDRIAQARSLMQHPNLSFEVRDVVADPPQERYDAVICSHVIEHIDEPVAVLRALERCAPRLLVAVPPMNRSWHKIVLREHGLRWMDDPDHRREYTPELLREQLAAAGWVIDDLHEGYDIKADCHAASLPSPQLYS